MLVMKNIIQYRFLDCKEGVLRRSLLFGFEGRAFPVKVQIVL